MEISCDMYKRFNSFINNEQYKQYSIGNPRNQIEIIS